MSVYVGSASPVFRTASLVMVHNKQRHTRYDDGQEHDVTVRRTSPTRRLSRAERIHRDRLFGRTY